MTTVWLLYILIFFNGIPKLELQEYNTEQECEQERIRIIQEIKDVYHIDAEVVCLYIIKNNYNKNKSS